MFTTAVPAPPLTRVAMSAPAVSPLPRFNVLFEPGKLAIFIVPLTLTVPFAVRFSVLVPPTPRVRLPLFVQVPPLTFAVPLLPASLPT